MKITETRKAIIEFIKPCMNKTLYEGCLYRFQDDEIKSMTKYEALNSSAFLEIQEAGDTEIIGHYDITAVLKYFEEHFYSGGKFGPNIINIEKDYIEIQEIKKLCKCDIPEISTIIGKFPNKPLYLYTEKEEKKLLELLQKLG